MTALRNVNDDAKRYTITLIYKKRIIEATVSVVAVADSPTKLTVQTLLSCMISSPLSNNKCACAGHFLEARWISRGHCG